MRERTLVVAILLLCCLNAYAIDADEEQEGYQLYPGEEGDLFNECAPIRVDIGQPMLNMVNMTPLFNQLAVQKTIVNKLRDAGIEAEGVMYDKEGIGIVHRSILPVNSKGISTTDMLSIGIPLSSAVDEDLNGFVEDSVHLHDDGFDIELKRALPTGYGRSRSVFAVWSLNQFWHRHYIYGYIPLLGIGPFGRNYEDINYVWYLLEKEVDFFITLYLSVNREYCGARKEKASE